MIEPAIQKWLKNCEEVGRRFAFIRTVRAIYDRVVIMDMQWYKGKISFMKVAYPKKARGKTKFGVCYENIPGGEIEKVRFYQ